MWYGLRIGLAYSEVLIIPLGELSDLITIEQIKHEGATLKRSYSDDEIIPDVR